MANPPLRTADPPAPRTPTLSVTHEVAVADGRGAQLVFCTITPKVPPGQAPAAPAPLQAVAKIYDSLYYPCPNKDVPSVPCDVTWLADQDYSREAAAYEHLQAVGQTGSFAPNYFGSWTFTARIRIGNKAPQSRPVRLILVEYVRGPSIRELCSATTFGEAYRLEVLARVLDGDAKLRLKGINQRDLAARNVLLKFPPGLQPAAQQNTVPRLVLIDYNISIVYAKTRRKIGPCDGMTLPPNPMQLHWNNPLQEFRGWIPAAWEANPRLRQEWLSKRFGGKNIIASYAPLAVKLEFAT
jgi:serine/threonine protein kinase